MYFREMAITYSIIIPNYPIVMGLSERATVMHCLRASLAITCCSKLLKDSSTPLRPFTAHLGTALVIQSMLFKEYNTYFLLCMFHKCQYTVYCKTLSVPGMSVCVPVIQYQDKLLCFFTFTLLALSFSP